VVAPNAWRVCAQIPTQALSTLPGARLCLEAMNEMRVRFAHFSDAFLSQLLPTPPFRGLGGLLPPALDIKRPLQQAPDDVSNPSFERVALGVAKGSKPAATGARAHVKRELTGGAIAVAVSVVEIAVWVASALPLLFRRQRPLRAPLPLGDRDEESLILYEEVRRVALDLLRTFVGPAVAVLLRRIRRLRDESLWVITALLAIAGVLFTLVYNLTYPRG
jgi:hypothetical protein